jgi:hypothetical protein
MPPLKSALQDPGKMAFISPEDEWVEPESVASVMLSLIESNSIKPPGKNEEIEINGGLILEVGKDQVRPVEPFNDPGPSGKGYTMGNAQSGVEEVFEWLGKKNWGST